jgi:hypothetical protein
MLINKNNTISLEEFKSYSKKIISNLENIVLDKQDPQSIQFLFDFIFEKYPTFEDVENQTLKIYPIFSISSQQKNPQNEDLVGNLKWQPH